MSVHSTLDINSFGDPDKNRKGLMKLLHLNEIDQMLFIHNLFRPTLGCPEQKLTEFCDIYIQFLLVWLEVS